MRNIITFIFVFSRPHLGGRTRPTTAEFAAQPHQEDTAFGHDVSAGLFGLVPQQARPNWRLRTTHQLEGVDAGKKSDPAY